MLTLAEGEAIAASQWPQVEYLQCAKQNLRRRIEITTRELLAECAKHGLDAQQAEAEFHPLLQKLIALEGHNAQALEAQQRQARKQEVDLRAASAKLRQLKRSYTPRPEALWQSYS